MTKKAIVENCNRLSDFLKSKRIAEPEEREITCMGLMHLYGKIMDGLGAPQSGWGYIFLSGNDFKEMKDYVENNPFEHKKVSAKRDLKNGMFSPEIINFSHLGYNWHIVNK